MGYNCFFFFFFFSSSGAPLVYAISPVVLVSGETYRMTCSAYYDYPKPLYTWSRADGVPLTPSRFLTISTGQLVVEPASTSDQTLFVCEAKNQYGSSSFMQAITIHGERLLTHRLLLIAGLNLAWILVRDLAYLETLGVLFRFVCVHLCESISFDNFLLCSFLWTLLTCQIEIGHQFSIA